VCLIAGVNLLESIDLQKDQTLFLSQIHQRALQRTMFPIGHYNKSFVKQLARGAGLDHIVRKKEASGVGFSVSCFPFSLFLGCRDGNGVAVAVAGGKSNRKSLVS